MENILGSTIQVSGLAYQLINSKGGGGGGISLLIISGLLPSIGWPNLVLRTTHHLYIHILVCFEYSIVHISEALFTKRVFRPSCEKV